LLTYTHHFFSIILFLLVTIPALAQEGTGATLIVETRYAPRLLETVNLEVICSSGDFGKSRYEMRADDQLTLKLTGFQNARTSCQLLARLPDGYSVEYSVRGGEVSRADKNGCQYARIRNGDTNHCLFEVTQDPVNLTVYKKWIGGSSEDADVTISLSCESGEYSGERLINEGSPGGWEISEIDPEGILCNISEEVRDNFRPDIIDCQGLYIRPGRGEECTLINTKIVKQIEMLNRYGKIVMIVLVLFVGLVAVKRLT
jgi:hypothetical protein